MAFTGNIVAGVAHVPRVLGKKLKEELAMYGATHSSISTVMAAGIEKLNECDGIMSQFQAREEMIQTDILLSPAGKQKQMEAAAKEFFAKLKFVGEAVASRQAAARELRAQLEKVPPSGSGDKVVEFLTGQEIRGELRKLAQPARMKLLSERTTAKDLAILRAVETNPLGAQELIPDEFRERLKEDLAETNQAADYARWKALVFVAEKLQLLANVLETTLGKYRLEPPTFSIPPIGKADLKMQNTQRPAEKSPSIDRVPDEAPAVH
ncbi:MAG: hypothetical protein OEU68_07280 [Nitrospira sp.]|nr:hypothetical protein [Nitrospira sp.]MDH4245042.1 hypothetical protein [Nitrospira sp.]MDH4355953.1 hypothetical protein [Nitrospira sp.]MDH5319374.1 hypothetical protein [Nitrospira sp.]